MGFIQQYLENQATDLTLWLATAPQSALHFAVVWQARFATDVIIQFTYLGIRKPKG